MKWVKMFYCIFFFSLLIIDLSATGIVFAPPSFQRYMIYDESMETFLYKMSVCARRKAHCRITRQKTDL